MNGDTSENAGSDNAEVVEFLKLVEQARTEAETNPDSVPVIPEPPPAKPKKYKFGLKKKAKEPKEPIQVLVREVQQAPIPTYISVIAILVALFVSVSAVLAMSI